MKTAGSPPKPTNLSSSEIKGLKWLEQRIKDGTIAITKADKGGATLIIDPDLIKQRTQEKLENQELYDKLDCDPTQQLYEKLFKHWVQGKEEGLISARDAKEVMGVSDNTRADQTGPTNRPSTLPHYRPGQPYFYPAFKIHKLKKEELIPGAKPPARLITALHEGASRRPDVFLADKYLRQLERDFCEDLLIDNRDALVWLDNINNTLDIELKSNIKAFTFDYKALYDSLSPHLTIQALKVAMEEKRPEWSAKFKEWLIRSVELSFESSIGKVNGEWYRQKRGVPTGGSICVQLANIAVYHVMREQVYSDTELMEPVKSVKRYIDDGCGVFHGTKRQFSKFITTVNSRLAELGLNIDENIIEDNHVYVAFLDIKFCFDTAGDLQTDLHVKETDARSYLYFGSHHPNHTFSSIVYSACLRLRRIINDNERLRKQIDELKTFFFQSNYPKTMVDNISEKVKGLERCLKPLNNSNSNVLVPKSPEPAVRVISTFGSDQELVESIQRLEPELSRTRSFSGLSGSHTSENTPGSPISSRAGTSRPIFKFVRRTGTSFRRKLVKAKQFADDLTQPHTRPCGGRQYGTCNIISPLPSITVNGQRAKAVSGTCVSYNVVYLFSCQLCNMCYVGRTVQPLRARVNEHRAHYYKLISDNTFVPEENDDGFSLGKHLVEVHNMKQRDNFNQAYKVSILSNSSPRTLEVDEHRYIQKLRTIRPLGLNAMDPFGIPLLDLT